MRRSVAADLASLTRVRLNVEAAILDYPELVRLLNEARSEGYVSRGDGGPTGKGGHRDLSDRLRCTPEIKLPDGTIVGGDLVPYQDPAEEALADLGKGLQLLMQGAAVLRRVATTNLEHPASANYCRGGQCPAGRMADRGKAGRCSACSRFWYESASNPAERAEREYVGQPAKDVHTLSRIAC